MQRLHLFKDNQVPKDIIENVSNQIRQTRSVPKRLDHYEPEVTENFPRIIDFPKDYIKK